MQANSHIWPGPQNSRINFHFLFLPRFPCDPEATHKVNLTWLVLLLLDPHIHINLPRSFMLFFFQFLFQFFLFSFASLFFCLRLRPWSCFSCANVCILLHFGLIKLATFPTALCPRPHALSHNPSPPHSFLPRPHLSRAACSGSKRTH